MFSRLPALSTLRQRALHVPRAYITRHSQSRAHSRNQVIGHRWFSGVGSSAEGDTKDKYTRTEYTKKKERIHVYTLDSTKLVERQQPAITLSPSHTKTTIWFPSGGTQLWYRHHLTGRLPFPEGTTGFLYYHRPADRPPLSGEVRFRITPSADPASFASGYDLMAPPSTYRGLVPWSIPLLTLPHHNKGHSHILGLLSDDQLIPLDIETRIKTKIVNGESQYIFQLSDPFIISCASTVYICLRVVGPDGAVHKMRPSVIQFFRGVSFKSGLVKVRFERSTLPEHAGRQVVVMRCLEIIKPLEVVTTATGDAGLQQVNMSKRWAVPGQLVRRPGRFIPDNVTPPSEMRYWAYDVTGKTSPVAHGLRLLL